MAGLELALQEIHPTRDPLGLKDLEGFQDQRWVPRCSGGIEEHNILVLASSIALLPHTLIFVRMGACNFWHFTHKVTHVLHEGDDVDGDFELRQAAISTTAAS